MVRLHRFRRLRLRTRVINFRLWLFHLAVFAITSLRQIKK